MKVEISFDSNFDSNDPVPIFLGRFNIGGYIARFVFTAAGKTRLYIPEEALADGSIVLMKALPVGPLGLSK